MPKGIPKEETGTGGTMIQSYIQFDVASLSFPSAENRGGGQSGQNGSTGEATGLLSKTSYCQICLLPFYTITSCRQNIREEFKGGL